MTDGLKNLTTKAAFNGLTAFASVGTKKHNKTFLEEMTNAQPHPQTKLYQQQNPLDWLVRHCSPYTVVIDSRLSDKYGNKSDSSRECAGRTIMDWCRLRLESDNR